MNIVDERFNTDHPNLCPHLRWKGMFVGVEHDPDVPSTRSGHFWCVYTHSCLGPDRELVEPANCSSSARVCHSTGQLG